MTPDYAELHCVSNFSFLRGASHPEELIRQAADLGYRALAITDECSVAGVVRAWQAARESELELIVGSEFRLEDGLRLVLLATDRQGYGQLCRLITCGRGQAPKGSYRLSREDLASPLDRCLALWLPGAKPRGEEAAWLRNGFPDRCWVAVELLADGDDQRRLQRLQNLAGDLRLPAVACGDVHMHCRARRALQDTLTAIRLRRPLDSAGLALFANGERHLRRRDELARIYP
ncbi:MAG: PHP domain-containing protein, partial [Gammaproteobacteria bacterium]